MLCKSMIVLDPDYDNYSIISVADDHNHFVFDYYSSEELPSETLVHCFDCSRLRGEFRATRVSAIRFEATRVAPPSV